jgi:DUF971 family protein
MPEDPRIRPVELKAPHGAQDLVIRWADGQLDKLPHRILRGFCPCAACQGHSGTIRFQAGGNLELREIEQVGNYALGLRWGDGHDSGIYSFRFLRSLGELVSTHGPEGLEQLGELPRA